MLDRPPQTSSPDVQFPNRPNAALNDIRVQLAPTGSPAGSSRWLLLIVACLALVQVLCLRPGHIWGDDFAHYILQAKHLASLRGYVAREYIPNPEVLNLGPQTVPPGLSVLLASVYAIFGLNLTAMKIVLVVVFMAGLCSLDPLFSERLPQNWRYALITVIGLDPIIFRMRDEIETEKLFVALMLLSLWLTKRAYQQENRSRPSMRLAIGIGLCIFAASITRNVGFALVPVLPVLDLLRFQRIRRFTIISSAVAVIPTAVVSFLARSTSGYIHLFNFSPLWISHSAFVFGKTFEQFWWGVHPRWVGFCVLALIACLAARGVYLAIRRGIGPVEVFIVFYLGIVLPYFAPGYLFYLVPLFPFLVAYTLAGLRDVAMRTRFYRQVAAVSAVCTALLFGAVYARADWGRIPEGIGDPQFLAVCDFIDHQTSASDIVVFRKPRLLALVTGHRSTVYPMHLDRPPDPPEILAYLQTVHAGYVVIAHVSDPDFADDGIVERTLTRIPSISHPVYSNAHFVVYRFDSQASLR